VVTLPTWRTVFKRKPRGYTFYGEDPPEEELDAPGDEGGPAYHMLEKKPR
jgi:hypothetical protein